MSVTIITEQSNTLADTLNTGIGTAHKLRLYTSGDALLATMTYSAASAVVSTVSGAEVLTYSEANYTDETTAVAGTVDYATIETSGSAEKIKFSDPSTELSLSSTTLSTNDNVNVTADVVIKLPDSTA